MKLVSVQSSVPSDMDLIEVWLVAISVPKGMCHNVTTGAAPAVLKWSGQEVGGAMSSGGCG